MSEILKEKKPLPVIDEKNCAGCSLCVENCPKDCLEISKPKFHGDIHTVAQFADRDACIRCGICAKVCPIDAIRI